MKRVLLVVLLALEVAAGGRVANAAPGGREGPEVAQARGHYKAGEKAFNAGDYVKALAEFESGYALVPRPGFLLNMGHTERRLGHPARAREMYLRFLEAEPGSKQRDEVLGLISELERTLGVPVAAPPSAVPSSEPPPPPPAPSSSEPVAGAVDPAVLAPLPTAPEPSEQPAPAVFAPPLHSAAEVAGSSDESPPRRRARPLYRRWWFWAAVGAVAVGTTAAIVVGTRSTGPSFQDDGTLGRVGSP